MNAIMAIHPYFINGLWVFDDPTAGLVREPFVSGIPEMIERLVKEKGIADVIDGFTLIFSEISFPDFDVELSHLREDSHGVGNWYFCKKYGLEGWLCPALFKYFETAPKTIYIKAEPLHRRPQ